VSLACSLSTAYVIEQSIALTENSFEKGLATLGAALTALRSPSHEDLLAFAREGEDLPDRVRSIGRFFFEMWHRLHSTTDGVNAKVLKQIAGDGPSMASVSPQLRVALDYLCLWAEVDRYLQDHRLGRANHLEVDVHVPAIRDRLQTCHAYLGTNYGSLMLNAMLASFTDRKAAARLFGSAKEENSEFARAQLLDGFVATYLTVDQISARAEEIATRRATLAKNFEFFGELSPLDETSPLLLFSCDPVFFSAFFPYWASTLEYFREQQVRLHFIVVGDHAKVSTAVEHGLSLATAAARLRGVDPASLLGTLSFSTVKVPGYVDSPATLYACARYLLARLVSERLGGCVLVLDIDMAMRRDPTALLRALNKASNARFHVVMTNGLQTLVPARRHLAGSMLLPNGGLSEIALRHIEEYVYAGLSRPSSWTLDQNALTYASERVVEIAGPDSIADIGRFMLPFGHAPARSSYRDGQRLRSARP
jgi:hypothetical protein